MNNFKRIEIIENAFKQFGFVRPTPYEEDNKIVGWEAEGYTECGGDIGLFVDMRDECLDALNIIDVIGQFKETISNIDIDEEIKVRLDSAEVFGLSVREAVEDMSNYFEDLVDRKDTFHVGFINKEIVPYLPTILKDDVSEHGGTSHSNETVEEFILSTGVLDNEGYIPEEYSINELNKDLNSCGIKSIAPKKSLQQVQNKKINQNKVTTKTAKAEEER